MWPWPSATPRPWRLRASPPGARAPAAACPGRGLPRRGDKTGVLIYVALAERYAEILADAGIADRVDAGLWRGIIRDLTGAIRDGRIADGLMAAVQRSGAILAEHAPARPGDEDELPNKVILL